MEKEKAGMTIQSILFKEEFRCFPEGLQIEFKDRTTVIVGDNGAGKSSLIGLLRAHFETAWTPSELSVGDPAAILEIAPTVPAGTPLTYIDLATDLLTTRSGFDPDFFELQVSLRWKSSGQASLLQLSTILQQSEARIHILDEPDRGLSPGKQIVMAAALKEIIEERADEQFIITTHSPAFIKTLSNKVLVLPQAKYMAPEDYLVEAEFHGQQQARKYIQARSAEKREKSKS